MNRDGVEVKILTGDNELVARHICEQVGIKNPTIILGEELERTSDPALQHLAEETTVFARVSPMQKHRIILALKQRGHVVGYMGDGINDAPSLHAADVGISVAVGCGCGARGGRHYSSQTRLADSAQWHSRGPQRVRERHEIPADGDQLELRQHVQHGGASVFLPFLPMLPTQILLNNFLYDVAQITIPSDNVDEQAIRAPQRWDMRLIRNFMIFIGPISSIFDFLTFYVLLHYFHASQPEFHTGWFVESLATQTLVLFIIRTSGNPLKSRPSIPLAITTILIVIIGVVLPFSPLATLLGFTPLPGPFFTFLAISTITYLLLVEWAKRFLFSRAQA